MKAVGPIPTSLPRDELLYYLRRGNRPLAASVTATSSRYMPRRRRIVVTVEVDPFEYVRRTEP